MQAEILGRGKSRALSGLPKTDQGIKEMSTDKRAPEYRNEDGIGKEKQQQAGGNLNAATHLKRASPHFCGAQGRDAELDLPK